MTVMAVLGSGMSVALISVTDQVRQDAALRQVAAAKDGVLAYVADMGGLPSTLAALTNAGSQPDFSIDSTLQIGAGWRGPYLPDAMLQDPWATDLIWTVGSGVSSSTGAATVATIRSAGADFQSGTADDVVVEIYRNETFARVIGYVKDRSFLTVSGINVLLATSSAGTVASLSAVTDSSGRYEFLNVPVGTHALQLQPKLSYYPGTAFALGGGKDDVEFVLENLGKDNTSVSDLTVTYISEPQGYFRRVLVNGTEVRNSTSPRGGSGTLVQFEPNPTSFAAAGTGVIHAPSHFRVSSLLSQLPDSIVGNVGSGGTLKIRLEDFDNVSSGNGNAVDMTGVTFEILMSDGSRSLFTTVKK